MYAGNQQGILGAVDCGTGSVRRIRSGVLRPSRREGTSFYRWQRRLCGDTSVRFAEVKMRHARVGLPEPALEPVLANGERLRIARGVDAATLRLTLDVVRA
jgi:hypothetical protein